MGLPFSCLAWLYCGLMELDPYTGRNIARWRNGGDGGLPGPYMPRKDKNMSSFTPRTVLMTTTTLPLSLSPTVTAALDDTRQKVDRRCSSDHCERLGKIGSRSGDSDSSFYVSWEWTVCTCEDAGGPVADLYFEHRTCLVVDRWLGNAVDLDGVSNFKATRHLVRIILLIGNNR